MTPSARSFGASILKITTVVLLWLAVGASSCDPLIAAYDHGAYQQATALKAETLVLMDKATEDYSKHEKQVDELRVNLEKAYEYAKGRPQNSITRQEWELIKGDDLVGGFMRLWKEQKRNSPAFIAGKKKQVAQAFDLLICLEVNKKETTDCKKSPEKK